MSELNSVRKFIPEFIQEDKLFKNPRAYTLTAVLIGLLVATVWAGTPDWFIRITQVMLWIYSILVAIGVAITFGMVFALLWVPSEVAIKLKSLSKLTETYENRSFGFLLDGVTLVLAFMAGFTIPGSILLAAGVVAITGISLYKRRLKELVMFKLSYNPDASNED